MFNNLSPLRAISIVLDDVDVCVSEKIKAELSIQTTNVVEIVLHLAFAFAHDRVSTRKQWTQPKPIPNKQQQQQLLLYVVVYRSTIWNHNDVNDVVLK